MTPGHRIRLRGFWEQAPTADGRVRHRRAFGRPRTLEPGERAWLVGDRVPGPATVFVNGSLVGETVAEGPFAFDVTDQLLPRNEAVIETVGDLGEVAVEIRAV
jgi:uncharacterized protein (DUF2249 family)